MGNGDQALVSMKIERTEMILDTCSSVSDSATAKIEMGLAMLCRNLIEQARCVSILGANFGYYGATVSVRHRSTPSDPVDPWVFGFGGTG